MTNNARPLSVSQFVNIVSGAIANEPALNDILIVGEVANLSQFKFYTWFFDLKEKEQSIKMVMSNSDFSRIGFKPVNGDMVIVRGSAEIYRNYGTLQVRVTNMWYVGAGNLYAQYAKMKAKLEPLGYFEKNRPIPPYPIQISVVCGQNSAAENDVRTIVNKRWPMAVLKYCYATVQGSMAAESIVRALRIADDQGSDVIILARGGGADNDLWCFNDESVATAIFNCRTPVVTGIGHSIDNTIAELVADHKCATPTEAATFVTPDQNEVRADVRRMLEIIRTHVHHSFNDEAQTYDLCTSRLEVFTRKADSCLQDISAMINLCALSVSRHADMNQLTIRESMKLIRNSLSSRSVMEQEASRSLLEGISKNIYKKLDDDDKRLRTLEKDHKTHFRNYCSSLLKDYLSVSRELEAANPLKIMNRGYSIVSQNEKVISAIGEVDMNADLEIRFKDGILMSKPIGRK